MARILALVLEEGKKERERERERRCEVGKIPVLDLRARDGTSDGQIYRLVAEGGKEEELLVLSVLWREMRGKGGTSENLSLKEQARGGREKDYGAGEWARKQVNEWERGNT